MFSIQPENKKEKKEQKIENKSEEIKTENKIEEIKTEQIKTEEIKIEENKEDEGKQEKEEIVEIEEQKIEEKIEEEIVDTKSFLCYAISSNPLLEIKENSVFFHQKKLNSIIYCVDSSLLSKPCHFHSIFDSFYNLICQVGKNIKILVVLNKIDLFNKVLSRFSSPTDALKSLLRFYSLDLDNIHFVECSVKLESSNNIPQLVEAIKNL